jgi:peptidoglycan/LPS O-acetylase OafA/YrhL
MKGILLHLAEAGSLNRDRTLATPDDSNISLVRQRAYFPCLDEVRGLGALSVMVNHFEQMKLWAGYKCLFNISIVAHLGLESVRVFFVISGFLICYLLLQEQRQFQKIDIGKFYVRRILRIWPLYYLIIFVSFFLVPHLLHFPQAIIPEAFQISAALHEHFWEKLGLFMIFLPNLCLQLYPLVIGASQCWTLALEEQFYLFCPVFLTFFRSLPVVAILAICSLKYIALLLINLTTAHSPAAPFASAAATFVNNLDFESFTAGGLAAFVLIAYPKITRKIVSYPMLGAFLAVAVMVLLTCDFQLHRWAATATFAVMVLHLAVKSTACGAIRQQFRYLGRISYGMYMFHPIVMCSVILLLQPIMSGTNVIKFNFWFYSLSLAGTVAAGAISYKYFEQPFLRLKDKLAIIRNDGGSRGRPISDGLQAKMPGAQIICTE